MLQAVQQNNNWLSVWCLLVAGVDSALQTNQAPTCARWMHLANNQPFKLLLPDPSAHRPQPRVPTAQHSVKHKCELHTPGLPAALHTWSAPVAMLRRHRYLCTSLLLLLL